MVQYAPHTYYAPHAHDTTSLTLVIRGEIEERVASRVEHAGPLSVVVKPAGVEHADTFGPNGASTLQVVLSQADATQFAAASSRLDAWRWSHAAVSSGAMLALLRLATADPLATEVHASVDDHVLDVIAALEPAPEPRFTPRWLREAHALLASTTQTIRTIAISVGVHPVYLAYEFRRHEGMSPTEYRRRERLRRAARLIAETRKPLAEIALEWRVSPIRPR